VMGWNILRSGRDDSLWELVRDDVHGARKRQSLREVSFSISFWFLVAFERFTVPVRVLWMICSTTRLGAADCNSVLYCRQDRFS
jgi:hypothetical protein